MINAANIKGPRPGQKLSRNSMSNAKPKSRTTKRVISQLPVPVVNPTGSRNGTGTIQQQDHIIREGSASLALDSYELKPLQNHAKNILHDLEVSIVIINDTRVELKQTYRPRPNRKFILKRFSTTNPHISKCVIFVGSVKIKS